MTVVEICITAYLIVGGLATILIWAALMVSKPREQKVKNVRTRSLGYSPFRERNTKPSGFHP